MALLNVYSSDPFVGLEALNLQKETEVGQGDNYASR